MDHLKSKLAVVTGASSGIGACIVKDLLAADLIVIGLARRIERVVELQQRLPKGQQERLHPLKCDVADASEVAKVFSEIAKTYGPIYVLVNNAGCLRAGQLCRMDTEQAQEVLLTNVMGVVNCTRHAFGSAIMKMEPNSANRCHGHVILINSILGHNVAAIPGHLPALNIYPATKFALTAINEIYRQEFKELGTQIKVTSISPGLVDTEFISEQQKQICRGSILQPEDISRAVMFALAQPMHVQIYELTIKPMGEMI